jgi:hypothetical protein
VPRLNRPMNFRLGERLTQGGHGGKRVDDIPNRAETNHQESLAGLSHFLPGSAGDK